MEAFDFAAGGGVVGSRVLLADAESDELRSRSRCGRCGRLAKRVVNTKPLSVKVENGDAVAFDGGRKVATTIGPVTRWWAVTDRA